MSDKKRSFGRQRRGTIAVLGALMIAGLVALVAFAVDYGYLLKVRTDLQRAADAAALAAVQDLIPVANNTGTLDEVRSTARAFARDNLEDASFQIADADITIGRFDPATVYSKVDLLSDGTFDAVRVTLRRDGSSNPLVPLFFARAMGHNSSAVTASATAVLQKAEMMLPGADILPFATPKDVWDDLEPEEEWSGYADGKLADSSGNPMPGNWGTLDIGLTDNSTSDLVDQILNGLRQVDIRALKADGRIESDSFIRSSTAAWMNGDPGLSIGIKAGVQAIHGQRRIIPIYDKLGGTEAGSNVEFHVVRWGVVTVVDSKWTGEKKSYVKLEKSHMYSGELRPQDGLDGETMSIDGAYTSPVLVE